MTSRKQWLLDPSRVIGLTSRNSVVLRLRAPAGEAQRYLNAYLSGITAEFRVMVPRAGLACITYLIEIARNSEPVLWAYQQKYQQVARQERRAGWLPENSPRDAAYDSAA